MGVSKLAQSEAFELDAEDAKALGEAAANVMKFYGVKMTPKQEAWALLIEAAANVYPPMVATYIMEQKIKAREAAKNRPPQPPRPPQQPPPKATAPAAANGGGPANQPAFDPFAISIPDGERKQ